MQKPRILVVGSFVMDQIAVTTRFPKEGETVFGMSFHKAPGGKGANQAVQAARLGAAVSMVGKIGEDGNGDEMLAACDAAGICTDHVLRSSETASGCSMIILEEAQNGARKNRILVIPGANMALSASDVAFLRDAIKQYDLVMLQLEIPMEINELVAEIAFENGVPVMLNPAPSAPLSDRFLSHLTFLSPNEHEAADLTSVEIRHEGRDVNMDDVRRAAAVLQEKGVRNVLITLGDAGAVLCTDDGFFYAPCLMSRPAVDPTAAGDSFLGAFCTGFCCGWPWEEILKFANETAGVTVSAMGAMPSLPTLETVKRAMHEDGVSIPDTAPLE